MVKRLLKHYTTRGLRKTLRDLRWELGVAVRHVLARPRIARRFRDARHVKLHLGCGPNLKEGWLNVDMGSWADVRLDLREPFPFPDGMCSIIYSEHFMEHIDYPEPVRSLLRECLRVLEPGGIFSVSVPDTEWPLLAYAERADEDYFGIAKERFHPKWIRTRMEHINFHFRQSGEHRFAYDYETMRLLLEEAGFTDVHRREFDASLDTERRSTGGLFVEARKASPGPAVDQARRDPVGTASV